MMLRTDRVDRKEQAVPDRHREEQAQRELGLLCSGHKKKPGQQEGSE